MTFSKQPNEATRQRTDPYLAKRFHPPELFDCGRNSGIGPARGYPILPREEVEE